MTIDHTPNRRHHAEAQAEPMNSTADLHIENHSYWTNRSSSYSDVNKEELTGESHSLWQDALDTRIMHHYGNRARKDIHVLDIGTGPGFFAIILAELGYRVTAVDMTPAMLAEAKQNAGSFAGDIDFREMNAESLILDDDQFDVIVSRNLTWNLPHPEAAYSEWCRVLRPGGLLLNFDSNWYSYLFNDDARVAYELDRAASEELGLGDQNIGENFDLMEDIARKMPLSGISRPEWDICILSDIGCSVSVNEAIWRDVWTRQEQTNFSSTPMFLISAVNSSIS